MSELFSFSEVKQNFSIYFKVHASFATFLTLRKVEINWFLKSMLLLVLFYQEKSTISFILKEHILAPAPMKIGVKKSKW